jgi:bifunctional non-homologous end joining protein LigD
VALDEYRRKRDFTKSPEPRGTVRQVNGGERFFCVQKHLASHLHYDLRLEHNGVLLSWAVPKGPSLDPKTKRLAMHVEDHPRDYGEFEGVIPEGYGAGIVMLWDTGTWTPEVADVGAALAKGDLKFTLNGYKLKGSWVLVRTSGRYAGARGGDGGRSWLLIKHRDDWSGELDITTFAPRSVKSDGDFEDILAADDPAVWTTNRPAKVGETGEQFTAIIERAAALKAGRTAHAKNVRAPKVASVSAKAAPPKSITARAPRARKTGGPAAKKRSGQVGARAKSPRR